MHSCLNLSEIWMRQNPFWGLFKAMFWSAHRCTLFIFFCFQGVLHHFECFSKSPWNSSFLQNSQLNFLLSSLCPSTTVVHIWLVYSRSKAISPMQKTNKTEQRKALSNKHLGKTKTTYKPSHFYSILHATLTYYISLWGKEREIKVQWS